MKSITEELKDVIKLIKNSIKKLPLSLGQSAEEIDKKFEAWKKEKKNEKS